MVPYLFWVSIKSPDISIKIKLIPFLPTTITLIWFVFPLMSVFYLIPLIAVYYVLIKKIVGKSDVVGMETVSGGNVLSS
jgi:hypothetical protein